MTSQRKWSSAKPSPKTSIDDISRSEMITKLRIFNEKLGTDVPPDGADLETVKAYYHKALEAIEDNSNKNYSMLQTSLQEFADVIDVDEEDPGREKSGCCSRFWDWVCNLYIFRSCVSQLED